MNTNSKECKVKQMYWDAIFADIIARLEMAEVEERLSIGE